MNLNQLRYLEKVVAMGGFRRAARELGIAQPTLTTQIRELELDMGHRLLDRSRRPIRATPAGTIVVRHAQDILASLARIDHDIAQIVDPRYGRLALGTVRSLADLLSSVSAEFAEVHPNLDVRLQQGTYQDLLQRTEAAELDAFVVQRPTDSQPLSSDLNVAHLFSFQFVFVVPLNHAIGRRTHVSLADLQTERFVLTAATTASNAASSGVELEQAFTKLGIQPRVAFRTTDFEMVLSLVAKGMGIGFVPDFSVAKFRPSVRSFRVSDASFSHDALLAWPTRLGESGVKQAFIQFATSRKWTPS